MENKKAKELVENEDNLKLVRDIAKSYSSKTTIEYEDLCQEGMLGLMRAAEKFKPEMGNKFSTYATFWIRQKIGRAIENSLPTTKKLAKKRYKIYQARKRLEEQGIDATYELIAEELGLTEVQVASVLNVEQISIDAQLTSDDETSFAANIPDEGISIEEQITKNETASMLREIVDKLSDLEREVIYQRYFSNELKISTYEEVSNKLNISRQRIQQLEKKALQKLKKTKELWRHINID